MIMHCRARAQHLRQPLHKLHFSKPGQASAAIDALFDSKKAATTLMHACNACMWLALVLAAEALVSSQLHGCAQISGASAVLAALATAEKAAQQTLPCLIAGAAPHSISLHQM